MIRKLLYLLIKKKMLLLILNYIRIIQIRIILLLK